MSSPSRRTFLAGSAAGALAMAAPTLRALGANERLNIGLIGSGNRGRSISTECVKAGHNVVATADVAKFRLDWIAEQLAKAGQRDKPATYDNHHKLLEHKGLDAVIVANRATSSVASTAAAAERPATSRVTVPDDELWSVVIDTGTVADPCAGTDTCPGADAKNPDVADACGDTRTSESIRL